MGDADRLHIAVSSDDRYVAHSAATVRSVLTAGPAARIEVEFLHQGDLRGESRLGLERMVDELGGGIQFHQVARGLTSGLQSAGYISEAMWLRLALPDLLPDVDRLLYLDVDTIALDSIEPLWAIDLEGHHLGAVSNVFQEDHIQHARKLGIDPPEAYFNSGVLLMNLDLMRRKRSMDAVRDFAIENPSLRWPDQDALNVVLGHSRLRLHPRWNVMNAMFRFPWGAYVFGEGDFAEAKQSPAIRHFEGPGLNKPWHLLCRAEHREEYFRARTQTPWPEVALHGRSARNQARFFARRVLGR